MKDRVFLEFGDGETYEWINGLVEQFVFIQPEDIPTEFEIDTSGTDKFKTVYQYALWRTEGTHTQYSCIITNSVGRTTTIVSIRKG